MVNDYEKRLEEIQNRIIAVLEADLANKTSWNRNIGWNPPGQEQKWRELKEHALEDMVWMMQELVSTRALLFAKEKRVSELTDQLREDYNFRWKVNKDKKATFSKKKQ